MTVQRIARLVAAAGCLRCVSDVASPTRQIAGGVNAQNPKAAIIPVDLEEIARRYQSAVYTCRRLIDLVLTCSAKSVTAAMFTLHSERSHCTRSVFDTQFIIKLII